MLRRPLPEDLIGRPFTVAEALALGVSRQVLENSVFRKPFPGVRVHEDLGDSLHTDCAAAALVLPSSAAMARATAATLLGLPLPQGMTGRAPVQASVPTGSSVPRVGGIETLEGLDTSTVIDVRGLRVVGAGRTWCDLARRMGDVDALILGDAVVSRDGGPACAARAVARRAGGRDVVRLRDLLERTRHPIGSPMETRWRLLVQAAGIPEPLFNQPVHDRHGQWLGVPDDQWTLVRVATEYDGVHHYRDARQWRKDISRKELLEDEGWRVLRLTADDVLVHPARAVDRLWRILHERGLPGLPPRP